MSGSAHTPPAPEQGGDPSMEDILASIRRILNEEEPRSMPAAPAAAPAPSEGVLDLTPAMRADPPPAPTPAPHPLAAVTPPAPPPPTAAQPTPAQPAPEPASVTPPPIPPPMQAPNSRPILTAIPEPPSVPEPLPPIAPTPEPSIPGPSIPEPPIQTPPIAAPRAETRPAEPPTLIAPAAAAAAAASMGELVRRLASTQTVAITRGGPTIEDLVREEIRGLLKAWLDENLPRVVERLVQAEIERVVGRQVG